METMKKRDYRALLRSLVTLSIPAIVEHIMSTLMQYVDTAMVGHLGEEATAAVSTTTTVNWLVNCVPFAVGTAGLALISQANGEGNRNKQRSLVGAAAFLTLVTGSAMTVVCLVLAPWIPRWMGAQPEVQEAATQYFAILSLPMVLRTASYVFGSAIRATKNTRLPMRINLVANLGNVLLNGVFIYALRLGVIGAAMASAISYALAGVAMIVASQRIEILRIGKEQIRPCRETIDRYLKIGLPALATNVISCLGYVFFAGMVSGMGTTIFAAHSIAVTAEELFYMPGYGLRTATSTMIGNALGEGDHDKLKMTERISILISVGMMCIGGIVLYLVATPLMQVFTISSAVVVLGAEMLRIVAFSEPFYGLMVVLEGIFYGKGQTKHVFFVETCGMWGIRIVFTFLCVKVWQLGLRSVWYCMIADNVMKALCLYLVYRIDKRSQGA